MSCPRVRRTCTTALVLAVLAAGCTRSSDASDASDASVSADAAATSSTTAPSPSSTVASTGPAPTASPESSDAATVAPPSTTITVTAPEPTTPVSLEEVAEIGVPGLDSADAFCASWSRFAGSFQVVAVTAAFGSGEPNQLASLEVAAAPTVTAAYDQLVANWPEELAGEADLVADQFLGPFARRLAVAQESLESVAASPETIEMISEAWVAALAQRDPSTPEFAVDLSPELWDTIDAAAVAFSERLVPFGSDPSLVTDVSTPLTSEYLAVACPDQGTLSGQEVDTP